MDLPLYLDYNATAPILPEVADAVRDAALRLPGNPSSQHAAGRLARRALEDSKERIGELLGARVGAAGGDRVILTSGGTEANNLAIQGVAANFAPATQACQFILSPLEHPSVARTGSLLRDQGWRVDQLNVSSEGVVQTDHLADMISEATRLVSVVLAPSETGVLQPIADMAVCLQPWPAIFHTDAVQAVGKIEVDFGRLGVDALSCAAHKFHGPLGIGALLLKSHVTLTPQLAGGSQQEGLRPGTEMAALAVGMCRALELWRAAVVERRDHLTALRDRLENALRSKCAEMVVLGGGAPRLPNTSNVSFPGLDRQALVMALDLAGIACSAGPACASGATQLSAAHQAMGLSEAIQRGAVRFSVGTPTTTAEIDAAVSRISSVYNRLRRS